MINMLKKCSTSVQLVRVSSFRNDLLQNPYFRLSFSGALACQKQMHSIARQQSMAVANGVGVHVQFFLAVHTASVSNVISKDVESCFKFGRFN